MQYICGVYNQNEMPISRLTFSNTDECMGNIWVMNDISYTFTAYRLTDNDSCRFDISSAKLSFFKRWSKKGVIVGQKACPKFVRDYASRVWPANKKVCKENSVNTNLS
ncbi:MAG: hypothetical protein NC118_05955 [Eubacterium sp.]|nr:hypothetical protein [Eubacterium sp.]